MRSTRKAEEGHEDSMYIPTTAVVMAEMFKFAVAFAMQYKVTRLYVPTSLDIVLLDFL